MKIELYTELESNSEAIREAYIDVVRYCEDRIIYRFRD